MMKKMKVSSTKHQHNTAITPKIKENVEITHKMMDRASPQLDLSSTYTYQYIYIYMYIYDNTCRYKYMC